MFPLFLGQLKSNINIVYTGAKVSLFWSFDWLFSVYGLRVLAYSLSVVSGSINDLLAFEMHLGIINSHSQEFTTSKVIQIQLDK